MIQFCDGLMSAPGGRTTGWLNDGQVEFEPDGGYRIVVGPERDADNWIDTSGHRRGALLWRFVFGENVPEVPSVRRVRTSELALTHRGGSDDSVERTAVRSLRESLNTQRPRT